MALRDWFRRRDPSPPPVIRPWPRPRPPRGRSFDAALTDRLVADWPTNVGSINALLRSQLRAMRARARTLEQNNDHARHFYRLVANNVIGRGIQLQMDVRNEDGGRDAAANAAIEREWKRWGRPSTCEVTGRLSWADVQRLAMTAVARDGEAMVQIVRGHGPYRFAVRLLLADHLDEEMNEPPGRNGNQVRMGVELDAWLRPVAYHLKTWDPTDDLPRTFERVRVPADDMIHLFLPLRAEQVRGAPWLHPGLRRLHMLGKYEEAELVAARLGASKMGFYTSPAGDEPAGDDETEDGDLLHEAEAGMFERLPEGTDVKTVDWQHPNQGFGAFVKDMLRAVASGAGVSYTSFTGDLEAVNFSSIRAGLLDERDHWRVIQDWIAAQLHDRVFRAWLPTGLIQAGLPTNRIAKFDAATWVPRGWDWVDPETEVNAKIKEVAAGLNSRSAIAAERGRDFADLVEQIAEENATAAAAGVTLATATTGGTNGDTATQAGDRPRDPNRHAPHRGRRR